VALSGTDRAFLFQDHDVAMRNIVDVDWQAKAIGVAEQSGSLRALVEVLFKGRTLRKGVNSPQISDWDGDLSDAQKLYAATDVAATLAIYNKLAPWFDGEHQRFRECSLVRCANGNHSQVVAIGTVVSAPAGEPVTVELLYSLVPTYKPHGPDGSRLDALSELSTKALLCFPRDSVFPVCDVRPDGSVALIVDALNGPHAAANDAARRLDDAKYAHGNVASAEERPSREGNAPPQVPCNSKAQRVKLDLYHAFSRCQPILCL
jgi:hypothetical protein